MIILGKFKIALNNPLIGTYPKISHAPQIWPWWKLVHFSHNTLRVNTPSIGHRFWMYTRNKAYDLDFYIDNRPKEN